MNNLYSLKQNRELFRINISISDQLGMFAQKQHKGYCRQTFIGGNYGLLENVGGRGSTTHGNRSFLDHGF